MALNPFQHSADNKICRKRRTSLTVAPSGWTWTARIERHQRQFILIHAEVEIILSRRQSLVEPLKNSMMKALLGLRPGRRSAPVRILTGLVVAFLLAGCKMIHEQVPQTVPDYKPTNIYRSGDVLPTQ